MRPKFKVHGARNRSVMRAAALAVSASAAAGVSSDADAIIINTTFDDGNVLNPSSDGGLNINLSNLVNPELGNNNPDFEFNFANNSDNGTNNAGNNLQFNSFNDLTGATNSPVNRGAQVGPGNTFNEQFNLLTINPDGNIEGPFEGLNNVLIGLLVEVPGASPHYGWLQFDVAETELTVRSAAIESEPNTPIRAGATSTVPAPGSMALFALGATGIAAWRRRRETARS